MDTDRVDRGAVKEFVRGTLGCACPDEVFERVEVSGPYAEGLTQIAIGGRLLIRCHAVNSEQDLPRLLSDWLASGIAARDALGCNRLRLLVAVPRPEAMEEQVQRIRDSAGLPDDRIHVHVLAGAQVDSLLSALDGGGSPQARQSRRHERRRTP